MGEAVTDTTSSWIDIGETITTWSELAGLVEKYRANRWIFRGVDDAKHQLLPAIGRPGARKDMDTGGDLPFGAAEELDMLARFQREVRAHVTTLPSPDLTHDWDLRAVAQHHGLNTRLLDWSESPLIAAFFAVERSGLINGVKTHAALYGVPCPYVIDSNTNKWQSEHDVVAFYPPHLTPRITVQRGLFTVHKTPNQPWTPASLKKWGIPFGFLFGAQARAESSRDQPRITLPGPRRNRAHINWLHKWGIR